MAIHEGQGFFQDPIGQGIFTGTIVFLRGKLNIPSMGGGHQRNFQQFTTAPGYHHPGENRMHINYIRSLLPGIKKEKNTIIN